MPLETCRPPNDVLLLQVIFVAELDHEFLQMEDFLSGYIVDSDSDMAIS